MRKPRYRWCQRTRCWWLKTTWNPRGPWPYLLQPPLRDLAAAQVEQ